LDPWRRNDQIESAPKLTGVGLPEGIADDGNSLVGKLKVTVKSWEGTIDVELLLWDEVRLNELGPSAVIVGDIKGRRRAPIC
jgi:hypothetical protein